MEQFKKSSPDNETAEQVYIWCIHLLWKNFVIENFHAPQYRVIKIEFFVSMQTLVRLTLEHPQYPIEYSFPSHEEVGFVNCFVPIYVLNNVSSNLISLSLLKECLIF